MLKKLTATTNDVLPLILRLTLGIVMFPHGAQKLLGWWGGYGWTGTMGFFGTMGIPAVFGALAIFAEFFGALGLVTGLFTRVAALGIAANMAVAVATVHWHVGFFMNWAGNQKGEGFEYHLLAIGIALALIVVGGGRWSVDRVLSAGGSKQPEDVPAENTRLPRVQGPPRSTGTSARPPHSVHEPSYTE